MAEAVVGVVIEQLVCATTEWLKEEISMINGVDDELDNMSTKMQLIQEVLSDAENRSVTKKIVQEWLDRLQDASYEMEDVLDEWNTIVNKHKLEQPENNTKISSSTQISSSSASSSKLTCLPNLNQFSCFNSVKQLNRRRDLASRIKIINQKVDSLFIQKDQFKFISRDVGPVAPNALTMNNFEIHRTTTSLVNKSLIHGRDAEKEVLLSKLLGENSEGGDGITVVSIVGLGGLGKTTLAQLVYNDEKVIKDFEKRIWVCVSNTFDELKVVKAILEGLGVSHIGKDELQTLHQSVQRSLSEHKFLLVLDDVWNEKREKWEQLKACLDMGARGSKVLITTRSDKVARIMSTSKANMLRPSLISESDCWLLMSHVAFQGEGKGDVRKFENIGEEIARKCKGLPLAAKTLGGLLILKDTIEEWKEVLISEIWKLEQAETELFPHLFLSYRELPSALKRCFIFFSIFPKDYEIKVEELINLWIANGYINPTKEIYDLERVGQEYFRYLLSRSFFQVSDIDEEKEDSSPTLASMHDIMHDFALHLSRDNFLTITKGNSNLKPTSLELRKSSKSKKARHWFITSGISFRGCDVGRFRDVRTCLAECLPRDVTLDMLRRLEHVRTLSLIDCDLDEIPQEIGRLIHLRTLDLSRNYSIKELPEAVGDLYNLKYLFLAGLHLKKFPQSIGKLINLRNLVVDYNKWKLLAPESLSKLVNLQTLRKVHVEAGSRGLGFLKNLNQLHEDLEIVFKSDYTDKADANEAKLKSKEHIKKLTFNVKGKDVARVVLEALEPPTEVKVVHILNFNGTRLPFWINSLNYMTELEISAAENFGSLSPFRDYPYMEAFSQPLEKLKKLFVDKIQLPWFAYYSGGTVRVPPFPNLESLIILNYMEPIFPSWISCLNCLTKLDLEGALEVQSLPPLGKLPFLEVLSMKGLYSLRFIDYEFLGIYTSIAAPAAPLSTKFEKKVNKKVNQQSIISTSITYFPKLESLSISSCSQLEVWVDIFDDAIILMQNLYSLSIDKCPKLEGLPQRLLRNASSLRKLYISGCDIKVPKRIVEDRQLLLRLEDVRVDGEYLNLGLMKELQSRAEALIPQ